MQLQVWPWRRLFRLLPTHPCNALRLEFVSVYKPMSCGCVNSTHLCCSAWLCPALLPVKFVSASVICHLLGKVCCMNRSAKLTVANVSCAESATVELRLLYACRRTVANVSCAESATMELRLLYACRQMIMELYTASKV